VEIMPSTRSNVKIGTNAQDDDRHRRITTPGGPGRPAMRRQYMPDRPLALEPAPQRASPSPAGRAFRASRTIGASTMHDRAVDDDAELHRAPATSWRRPARRASMPHEARTASASGITEATISAARSSRRQEEVASTSRPPAATPTARFSPTVSDGVPEPVGRVVHAAPAARRGIREQTPPVIARVHPLAHRRH
jgi:hypothetical protein